MLYIVGTPIGNLRDLSINQAQILSSADVILSEDTRRTGLLLKQIEILFNQPINSHIRHISYYKETEFQRLPAVLELLNDNKKVVLISSAGMPLISDPGHLLINYLIKKSISFSVIPGPTAFVTALVHSGFHSEQSLFLGFLPKQSAQKIKLLKQITIIKKTLPELICIAYDSPNRIQKTLRILHELIPDSAIVIGRELTKNFEEILRGKPKELMEKTYKGEIVLLFS